MGFTTNRGQRYYRDCSKHFYIAFTFFKHKDTSIFSLHPLPLKNPMHNISTDELKSELCPLKNILGIQRPQTSNSLFFHQVSSALGLCAFLLELRTNPLMYVCVRVDTECQHKWLMGSPDIYLNITRVFLENWVGFTEQTALPSVVGLIQSVEGLNTTQRGKR